MFINIHYYFNLANYLFKYIETSLNIKYFEKYINFHNNNKHYMHYLDVF